MKLLILLLTSLCFVLSSLAANVETTFVGKTASGLTCGLKIETCGAHKNKVYLLSIFDPETSNWETVPQRNFLSSYNAHLNFGKTTVANAQASTNNILNYIFEKTEQGTFNGHSSLNIERTKDAIKVLSFNKEGEESVVTGSEFYGTQKRYLVNTTITQKCFDMSPTQTPDRRLLFEDSLCEEIAEKSSLTTEELELIKK